MDQTIIEKAKKYRKKRFRCEAYRRLYFQLPYMPAKEFENAVNGIANSNVIPLKAVKPLEDFDDYLEEMKGYMEK